MRIITLEPDYSNINAIYNTIEKIAKTNEYAVHQVLTTRKPNTVLNYLEKHRGELYILSLIDNSEASVALVHTIRQLDPSAQLLIITDEASKEIASYITTMDHTDVLYKTPEQSYEELLTTPFMNYYAAYIRNVKSK